MVFDKKMQEMGDVNMVAIKEYDEYSERKEELKTKNLRISIEFLRFFISGFIKGSFMFSMSRVSWSDSAMSENSPVLVDLSFSFAD